jgi:Short C-terminal domain/SmpA / OmlA family
MKSLLALLGLAAGLVLGGCNSASQLNNLRIGMTKDQVVSLLGQPDSMSAQANVEYLTYYFVGDPNYGRDRPYMVRIVDGKVESFGRFAQLIDLYDRPVGGVPPLAPGVVVSGEGVPEAVPAPAAPTSPNLVQQLEQLKALHDQGVLTDAEFAAAKSKLLGTGP